MTEKLLPCPFCGGVNVVRGGDDKMVAVFCGTCGACGPDEYGSSNNWNRRTPAPEGEACPHDAYETDAAGQPVRCVDCGMAIASAASPVVPVGVSRERVRLIVSGLLLGFTDFTVAEREAFIDRKTDAIIAALRPTDTGRE